jgi:DNA repair protein RecO (recombination protein O)
LPSKETVSDEVICLTRREFSETSQVLVFFSRQHGKVSVLAKGIKRQKGKTAGGIDLLDLGSAGFLVNTEGLGLLKDFSSGKPFPGIRNNLKKWYAALYLAEVVHLSTKELEPAPEIFDLLCGAITRISEAKGHMELAGILIKTLMDLLKAIGYQPELQQCINCKRKLTVGDWLFFSAQAGGLICRDCEPGIFEKIRIEQRAWSYLLGKTRDLPAAALAFDILNYMLREHLEKTPALASYCRVIFTPGPAVTNKPASPAEEKS